MANSCVSRRAKQFAFRKSSPWRHAVVFKSTVYTKNRCIDFFNVLRTQFLMSFGHNRTVLSNYLLLLNKSAQLTPVGQARPTAAGGRVELSEANCTIAPLDSKVKLNY